MKICFATLLLLAALSLPLSAKDKEDAKKVTLEQVPAPAAEALKKWAGADPLKRIRSETKNDQMTYEAIIKVENKPKRKLLVDAEGKTLMEEAVVPLAEAPEAVQKAAQELAKGSEHMLLEKIVRPSGTVYEVELKKEGKDQKIFLLPDGSIKPAAK
jgi:uncharacterized membrane protein YkoI